MIGRGGLGQYDIPPGYTVEIDPSTGTTAAIPPGPHGTSTIIWGDPSEPDDGSGGGSTSGSRSRPGGGGGGGSIFGGAGGAAGGGIFGSSSGAPGGGLFPGTCDPNGLIGKVFGCSSGLSPLLLLAGGVVVLLLVTRK
jgi:hypothetical protein